MIKIYPLEFDRSSNAFILPAQLRSPLLLLIKNLRSELKYDKDPQPKKTALKVIQSFTERLRGQVCAVIVSQHLSKSGSFRERKTLSDLGKIFADSELLELKYSNTDGHERLGVIVSLANYSYDINEDILLNYGYGMIVLSQRPIASLRDIISTWVSQGGDSLFGFDYEVVVDSLIKNEDITVIRYFPADNGRPEVLAVIGNEVFVKQNVEPYLL